MQSSASQRRILVWSTRSIVKLVRSYVVLEREAREFQLYQFQYCFRENIKYITQITRIILINKFTQTQTCECAHSNITNSGSNTTLKHQHRYLQHSVNSISNNAWNVFNVAYLVRSQYRNRLPCSRRRVRRYVVRSYES